MKKKIVWVITAAAILFGSFGLAACHDESGKVTVSYHGNYIENGQDVIYESQEFDSGEIVETPFIPTREGFVFLGWYDNEQLKGKRVDFDEPLEGSVTLYAKWRIASVYTIRFDEKSAPGIPSVRYTEGTDLSVLRPANPSRAGSLFAGWFKDEACTEPFDFSTSAVTASLKLYAGWEEDSRKFVVTFMTGDTVYREVLVDRYTPVADPGFAAEGFSGWMREDGTMYNFSSPVNFNLTLYAKISVPVGNGKTKIEDNEFADDESLVNAVIADSVTEIGIGAFSNCINLETVVLPAGVREIPVDCFRGCDKLKSVTFGGKVVSIGANAFNGCDKLLSVTLSEGLTELGNYAFYNCSSLETVVLPSTLTTVGRNVFAGCSALETATLPATMTHIGEGMFRGCRSLKLDLPATVTSVGEYAFYNSGVSGRVTSALKEIGAYAFYGCTGLTSIEIAKEVTSVGDYTFYGCTNAETLTFETYTGGAKAGTSDLESVGVASFSMLNRITSLVLPEGLKYIDDDAFRYEEGAFSMNTALESVSVPSSILRYGKEGGYGSAMFHGCVSLRSVTLANGLKTLGEHMFSSCTSLREISIPDSVTALGRYSFAECSALERVLFGANSTLTLIPERCFQKCTSLKEINLPDTVKTFKTYAFSECTSLSKINSNIEGTLVMPKSLEMLDGSGIFRLCTSIKTVDFRPAASVVKLGKYASDMFYGCTGLVSVVFGDNLNFVRTETVTDEETGEVLSTNTYSELPKTMFFGCTNLASTNLPRVETILEGAFSGCTALKSIEIPSSVKSFQVGSSTVAYYGVFYNSGLERVTFEEGSAIEIIAAYSFTQCASLKEISLPLSVKRIEKQAFYKSGLQKIVCGGSSLEYVGDYAFADCLSLTEVQLPETVTEYGYRVFGGCTVLSKVNSSKAGEVRVGSNATAIGGSLFSDCTNIRSAKFEFAFTSLPNGVFLGCTNLATFNSETEGEVILPDELTEIGATVFQQTAIRSVTFGTKLKAIGVATFRGCSKLTSVTIHTAIENENDAPRLGGNCFSSVGAGFAIYVPADSVEFYRNNSNWKSSGFAEYVKAIAE